MCHRIKKEQYGMYLKLQKKEFHRLMNLNIIRMFQILIEEW